MLKPISAIIKDSIGNIIFRGNVVTGTVAVVRGDGSYDVFISESDKAYPKIFTLSKNPDLAVGDKVRILYKNGCKELPIILPPTTAAVPVLFESYLAPGATLFTYAYGDIWRGQTFLTTSAHTINYVILLLARRYDNSVPGTIYIEIRKATAEDMPTEGILTSGETDGNTLVSSRAEPGPIEEWRRIDLTECNLEADTKYAITLHLIGGSTTHSAGLWSTDGNPYTDGKLIYSTNGGATWLTLTYDGGFKVYGKPL